MVPWPLAFILFHSSLFYISSLSETHHSLNLALARPSWIPSDSSCVLSQQQPDNVWSWHNNSYLWALSTRLNEIYSTCYEILLSSTLVLLYLDHLGGDIHECRFLGSQLYWVRVYGQIWESELKGTFGGSDTGCPQILGNIFLNYVPF